MRGLGIYLRNKAHVIVFVVEKPPRWKNGVCIRNAEALAESFVFQTTFRHRGGYSTTTILPRQQNKVDRFPL